MDYLKWNDLIGERFFNTDRSGTRVFLYVTTDVLNEIGRPFEVGCDDFIAAVKTGPHWNSRQNRSISQQALQALDNWRTRDLSYPPYLGYLAFFVLAATIDVGFARHAYYPGLRSLLGEEPESGMYPSFNLMYKIWDDLAVWSNQDRHGDRGIFDADIVGEWMHVGLPRAQTLLTDDEREKLPILFADNGFDFYSPPSEGALSYLLSDDPHHYLRTHTKELLKSSRETDVSIRAALIEALLDELEHWDGTVPGSPQLGEHILNSLGNLRLTMTLDRTARTVQVSMRCRSNREYPEEGLQLIGEGLRFPLYCYEDWQGWSAPLYKTETSRRIFDASTLDWRSGISLSDHEHAWRTSLATRGVRVMVSATPYGLDGFVEESQIPRCKPFYLIAHVEHSEMLRKWGRECCKGFAEVELLSGLPQAWHLYSIDQAETDAIIRETFPCLAFPVALRIQFRNGLKVRGNQYFRFALPHIEVTGEIEGVTVFCNDTLLVPHSETGFYHIPDNLCVRRFLIEVRRDNECIKRRSLYAMEELIWRDAEKPLQYDKFGRRIYGEATEYCIGPMVSGAESPEFNPAVFLPPSLGYRIYFIGRNPGEIVECPSETMSEKWTPVWAIIMEKKGKGNTVYCGIDPSNEEPKSILCGDPKHRRLWKEMLWHKRKQIYCSFPPTLLALWRKYLDVAQHVR